MTRRLKPTSQSRRKPSRNHRPVPATQPFIEHVQELRRRVYYVAISIIVWGCVIYGVQQQVVKILLKPARGEHFIYTSVGGGIDFLFRVCIYGAFVLSLPVIVYNTLRFLDPLMTRSSQRFVFLGSAISGILAFIGVIFGYFLGLPAALHFLLHQFTTVQIQPLVTIQSYLGFVVVYMVGSAMLFQLPLLLIFINRIKPLKPKRLLHYERWVILAAFILSGLMNPTPNIISQLLVAGPFILMYQVGILIIAIINRPGKLSQLEVLLQQDAAAQAQRLAHAAKLQPLVMPLPPQPSTESRSVPAARRSQLSRTRYDVPVRAPSAGSRTLRRSIEVL